MRKIIESNQSELFLFNTSQNIQSFSIFAFDIEFDNKFNPTIFEGNFYFSRFTPAHQYGKLTANMYNDIYHCLGHTSTQKYGFIDV